MVQFFNLGKSRSGKIAESLGMALGEGLGDFLGNYGAEKKLQSILADSNLKNKSPAGKLEALLTGLSRHGEYGAKRLKYALEVEKAYEEERQKKSKDEQNDSFIRYLSGDATSDDIKKLPGPLQTQILKNEGLKTARNNAFKAIPPKPINGEKGRDLEREKQVFYEALNDPNLSDQDRKFFEAQYIKNFPEEKPLTTYQQEYLDVQKENQKLRKKEFALKIATFHGLKKKDQIKSVNAYFNDQIKDINEKLKTARYDERIQLSEEVDRLVDRKKRATQKVLKGDEVDLSDFDIDVDDMIEDEIEEDFLSEITDEQLDELLEETGGDIQKAKKLALQRFEKR